MKFIFLFFISSSFLFSQELKFDEVVIVDSTVTKKELFNAAKIWLNDTYKSGKAVIQMEDSEMGILIGKATFKYEPDFFAGSGPARGYVDYTIKMSFKDGRFKFEFYDFIHDGSRTEYVSDGSIGLINDGEKYTGNNNNGTKSYRNKVNEDCQNQIKIQIPIIINSLKQYMVSYKYSNINDDW